MGGIMSVLASERKMQTDQAPSETVQKEVQVPCEIAQEQPDQVQKEEQPDEQTRIELMKKLENEGVEKLQALKNAENGIILTEKSLMDIMQSGGDEFEKQMGRKMTYSEMREMYG
jgi:hypothetical protein